MGNSLRDRMAVPNVAKRFPGRLEATSTMFRAPVTPRRAVTRRTAGQPHEAKTVQIETHLWRSALYRAYVNPISGASHYFYYLAGWLWWLLEPLANGQRVRLRFHVSGGAEGRDFQYFLIIGVTTQPWFGNAVADELAQIDHRNHAREGQTVKEFRAICPVTRFLAARVHAQPPPVPANAGTLPPRTTRDTAVCAALHAGRRRQRVHAPCMAPPFRGRLPGSRQSPYASCHPADRNGPTSTLSHRTLPSPPSLGSGEPVHTLDAREMARSATSG